MSNDQLNDFLSKEYLAPSSIANLQQRYLENSLNVIQVQNFLSKDVANSISHFLHKDAQYENVYGLFGKKNHIVEQREWSNASETSKFFRYQMISGSSCMSPSALSYLKLRRTLKSLVFREYIEKITNKELASSSSLLVHRMRGGDYLKKHNDRSKGRKIAFILYLSQHWSTSLGGQLHVHGLEKNELVLEPTYNSLVLFDVRKHEYHYVAPINLPHQSPSDVNPSRISINGWFL